MRRNHAGGEIGVPRDRSPRPTFDRDSFPKQGQFLLAGRSGDRRLRPADLKAGRFVIIDTKNPPPPAAELKTTPVIDINCVKATDQWASVGAREKTTLKTAAIPRSFPEEGSPTAS